MRTEIYVDETKAKCYLVAAVVGSQAQMAVFRKEISVLILRGQRGLHMKDERDARRREILDTIVRSGDLLNVRAVIYDAGRSGTEKERRERCLRALVSDAAAYDETRIVLDLDETLRAWDRQRMIELTRVSGNARRLTYDHESRNTERLLALPDALAWSWARGGGWRSRIEPIVTEVREV